jgi:hypothetical protein
VSSLETKVADEREKTTRATGRKRKALEGREPSVRR